MMHICVRCIVVDDLDFGPRRPKVERRGQEDVRVITVLAHWVVRGPHNDPLALDHRR